MKNYKFDQEKLVYRETGFQIRPIILGVVFGVVLTGLLSFCLPSKTIKEYVPEEIVIKNETPSDDDIFAMIDKYPFKYKDIIKAQALVESSHFKSEVFKHNKNIFGMRLAKQRLTLATGDNLKHATFDSYEDSILDRLIYESMYMNKLSREEYFKFLDKLYAEGENYSGLLKQVIKDKNL